MLPEPYERIHNQTMAPYAHLFWSSAWCGIATGAVRRARAFVRKAARSSGGRMPPAAAQLTRARVSLETLRGAVQAGLATFERHAGDPGGLTATEAQLALTLLKVEASELAATTVMSAMRACGLSGYRNDSEFAMGRYLRDILSAPIMINNDRILANAEAAVLMSEAAARAQPLSPAKGDRHDRRAPSPRQARRLARGDFRGFVPPDGNRRRLWPRGRLRGDRRGARRASSAASATRAPRSFASRPWSAAR